jgi:septum site-determining protein MinC
MAKEQPLVLLKGLKNGIAVQLDDGAELGLINEALRKKVADAREFFAGAKTNVIFKGRKLSEDEEKSLLDIIFSETSLDVSFVANEDFNASLAAAAPTPTVPPPQQEAPVETVKTAQQNFEQNTVYYRHGLRSGQAIRTDGSVVVLGDANAGSEIVAGGNVIVLGALRGMVHAGSEGNESCYVSALNLIPTQLRIAGLITSIQREQVGKRKQRCPEYAFIRDGQVYVDKI